jgi:prolyl 4-hydroxylase
VLKYEVGQRYKEHHDFISRDLRLPAGPRILTFYLYLSDVEEGGETSFPSLGIDVKPKKGKAVLWPNSLNSHPDIMVCLFFFSERFQELIVNMTQKLYRNR